ncbi:cellulase family glycosylhydrolase [Pontibacter chinhatensis]|uniref:Cellulase (Glycosyl hydrolase family 5) n=1 Tax=Pontibacter chinhatensis TaxID=1436961 RepID=A0A1I2NTL8_9BACT|nr:cellulase family glycosylhydrolase [Pontibacter chinhatensis]SFG04977.1 Cellulase (glycosyl hydrolase family 5) [Pontibacter chinhatensis]
MTPLLKTARHLVLLLILLTLPYTSLFGQNKSGVYVDKQGVMRWQKGDKEANFFGINYTVPFAYGYRSHKALGVDLEKAIDQDVYHFARMGVNAFRVHVWDTEISDSVGNLLENEHLRLFDYLVAKLKERNIKIFLTPIAFWGPGYPEPDMKTAGFSSIYNKQQAVTEEAAFVAQERYLQQFFKHVNPYTKLSYQDDPDIIAAEINNEPKHSGPKERATEYVNRMVQAVRGTGWTKPIFYNISESPTYADAVAKANIQGVTFQWYPTGLVANRTLQGNYLPHVDQYRIPFDTIPQYAGKARMVYEFDAGDILDPYMYPAMARSFRQAGFQWATQFAYDPLATAYGNTEYQTHYLNLAYTPDKAISLMIAAEAFLRLPRLKSYGAYPADTVFDVFRVSYKEKLSEMNTPEKFYYSGTTSTKPANVNKLAKVAGVGSSAVVKYSGTGAYFLDKLENGVWRLEVMPDAIHVSDPFAKASPRKSVTSIQWQEHPMEISLQDLGNSFAVEGLNEGNSYTSKASSRSFNVRPGVYLLSKGGKSIKKANAKALGTIGLREFVAPQPTTGKVYLRHTPLAEVSSGKPYTIQATIAGADAKAKVSLAANNLSGVWNTVEMKQVRPYTYEAAVPAELLTPGALKYRIIVEEPDEDFTVFPGGHKGNPWAWDYVQTDMWQTYVAAANGALSLFNPSTDQNLFIYPNLWQGNERQVITGKKPGQLILKLTSQEKPQEGVMGFQVYVGDKLAGRQTELPTFDKLVIRARAAAPVQAKLSLITAAGSAFAASINLDSEFREIEVPLSSLTPSAFILLPRPYPGFHPFRFQSGAAASFNLRQVEKLELTIGEGAAPQTYSFEIEGVWLEQAESQLD